jgi:hypothetical protein
MPNVSYEFFDQFQEISDELDDLKTAVHVAADDLRQIAATLHTEDHDSIYDAILDIAQALEREIGVVRREATHGAKESGPAAD